MKIDRIIGEALEISDSDLKTPTDITLSDSKSIIVEGKKTLVVNARFDCPCCGHGISIEIDYDE